MAVRGSLEHARRHVRRNFVVLSLLCMAEPFSSTILLPFVYFMVKGFRYSEGEIGSRAGLLTSAFFVVQIFSTPLWCIISNRVGRKPCLVFGLFGTAVAMIMFGTSQSLAQAIASRALCGLLNGNLAVSRTMVGELAEATHVQKGRAFSIFGFCIGMGWMIGPFIGGSLANPAESFGFTGPGGVLEVFPFLLPCVFSTVYNVAVGIAALFLLDETNNLAEQAAVDDDSMSDDSSETDPLIQDDNVDIRVEYTTLMSHDDIAISNSQPLNLRRAQGLLLLSSAFYFIHIICFDELYALFAASSRARGIGLSFKPQQIANSLAFAGPAMIGALLGFPQIHKRLASLPLYRGSAVVFLILYPIFSFMPKLAQSAEKPVLLWIPLIGLIIPRYAAMVIGLASLQIMFNDMVNPEERALMNGLGQSVGSLARAIGPSLGGFTWSWSLGNGLGAPLDFHASFVLLALLAIGQLLTTVALPTQKQLDMEHKIWAAKARMKPQDQQSG